MTGDILITLTPECEEDHLGTASISFVKEDEPIKIQPMSISNPSIEYPIPLTPLDTDISESDWEEIAAQAVKEMAEMRARRTTLTEEDIEDLDEEDREYCEEEFFTGSLCQ